MNAIRDWHRSYFCYRAVRDHVPEVRIESWITESPAPRTVLPEGNTNLTTLGVHQQVIYHVQRHLTKPHEVDLVNIWLGLRPEVRFGNQHALVSGIFPQLSANQRVRCFLALPTPCAEALTIRNRFRVQHT